MGLGNKGIQRFQCPTWNNIRLFKNNGLPRNVEECWTREWSNEALDIWVRTDDNELYQYPTYLTYFKDFCAPFPVTDYKSLLRRVKHLWLIGGGTWVFRGQAEGPPTPAPSGHNPPQ